MAGRPASRWFIVEYSIAGLAHHHQDLPALGLLVLACTGLGIVAVTEQTSERAVVTALLAARAQHTKLTPLPRK